jgi:hypothetical protein
MAHWLVLHSLKAFSEHPDLIGVVSAKGVADPSYRPFSRIRKADNIVYYAIRDSVILGIFTVVSGMDYLDDPEWGPSCVFKIALDVRPPNGKVLNLRTLLKDSATKLDIIPIKEKWQGYLRGHACRPLSENDYGTFRKALLNDSYLIPRPEVTTP